MVTNQSIENHIKQWTPKKYDLIDSASARVQRLTPIKSEPSEKKPVEKIEFPCHIKQEEINIGENHKEKFSEQLI